MTTLSFQQILTAAHQLPRPSQVELASTLLQETPPIEASTEAPSLRPLIGLTEAELRALAESVLAPRHARRLRQLLRLNREKELTRALRAEIDALLEESDRVALLKAKANYPLRLRLA